MAVDQWEELQSSPRQWCGACRHLDTTDIPWQGVGDVALPWDLSDPGLWPCPIPHWQGTNFSRVMPGVRAPSWSFTTTNTSTQPSRAGAAWSWYIEHCRGQVCPWGRHWNRSTSLLSLPLSSISCTLPPDLLLPMLPETHSSLALADFDLDLPVLLHSHQTHNNCGRQFSMICRIGWWTVGLCSCWAAAASVAG